MSSRNKLGISLFQYNYFTENMVAVNTNFSQYNWSLYVLYAVNITQPTLIFTMLITGKEVLAYLLPLKSTLDDIKISNENLRQLQNFFSF